LTRFENDAVECPRRFFLHNSYIILVHPPAKARPDSRLQIFKEQARERRTLGTIPRFGGKAKSTFASNCTGTYKLGTVVMIALLKTSGCMAGYIQSPMENNMSQWLNGL
jgi:hypothetical protein